MKKQILSIKAKLENLSTKTLDSIADKAIVIGAAGASLSPNVPVMLGSMGLVMGGCVLKGGIADGHQPYGSWDNFGATMTKAFGAVVAGAALRTGDPAMAAKAAVLLTHVAGAPEINKAVALKEL